MEGEYALPAVVPLLPESLEDSLSGPRMRGSQTLVARQYHPQPGRRPSLTSI